MRKKSNKKLLFLLMSLSLFLSFSVMLLSSCSGGSTKNEESRGKVADDEAFYATQPLHSGLYDADYYDITGINARKGRFDGRIYFSLSPVTSALYVFENGNRTKIDNMVTLQKPFEKGDSGIYYTTDIKNNPVTMNTDSAMYVLDFKRGAENYKITFNPKPRHEGTALDILEKMAAQRNKNNK